MEAVGCSGIERATACSAGVVDVDQGIEVELGGYGDVELGKEGSGLGQGRAGVGVDGNPGVEFLDRGCGGFCTLSKRDC